MIGRECIKKRIEMVESGAEVPNDILTHILQVACELKNHYTIVVQPLLYYPYTATQSTVDIEELVDDFVTYYIAGMSIP